METEAELKKEEAQKTDDGYSEANAARKLIKAIPSKPPVNGGNIFASSISPGQHTVFQAQKDKEI